MSGDDGPALSESDAPKSLALRMGAQDHHVAVLQEGARLAIGQRDGLRAASGEFEEGSALAFVRTGLRAASQQIAGLQIASIARVMRDELGDGPVGVAEVAAREAMRRTHRRRLQPTLHP